jgi:hypothetical protein
MATSRQTQLNNDVKQWNKYKDMLASHETIASYLTLVKSEPLLIVLAPERHDWPPSACMWLVKVNDFQGSKYHAD